jgi:hypothetical protein
MRFMMSAGALGALNASTGSALLSHIGGLAFGNAKNQSSQPSDVV